MAGAARSEPCVQPGWAPGPSLRGRADVPPEAGRGSTSSWLGQEQPILAGQHAYVYISDANKSRFSTFLSPLLSRPVYVVLQLDSHLPLVWLIPYERVFQELLCGGPLHVVLHQAPFYEAKKLLRPFF